MISACIITKNESENLRRCLGALAAYPFELVVVDTGSEDDSVKVAGEYTEHIFSYEWKNDFSDARNYAMSLASSDKIIMIDTDEFLTGLDYEKLEKMMNDYPMKAGRIFRKNIFTRGEEIQQGTEWITRIFDRRYFYYTGRIHEQVTARNGAPFETYNAPAGFDHTGYDGDEKTVATKAERNIKILLEELSQNPSDTYLLYQLGKSFYMKKDYFSALEYFERATSLDLDERLEYVNDLIISYGYTLINTGNSEKALGFENLYDVFGKTAEFRFLMGLIYMNNMMYDRAVESFLDATKVSRCSMDGVNSYKAYYNIGVIKECLGNVDDAIKYYSKCSNYQKALKRLEMLNEQK